MNKKTYLRCLDSRRNGLKATSIPDLLQPAANAKVVGAAVVTVPDVLVAAVADIFATIVVVLMLIYDV